MSRFLWFSLQIAIIGGVCVFHYFEAVRLGQRQEPAYAFLLGVGLAWLATWLLTRIFSGAAALIAHIKKTQR